LGSSVLTARRAILFRNPAPPSSGQAARAAPDHLTGAAGQGQRCFTHSFVARLIAFRLGRYLRALPKHASQEPADAVSNPENEHGRKCDARQREAVRGKRRLLPIVKRLADCQRSSNQAVAKMACQCDGGHSGHAQSAGLGRFNHRGGRWAQPWTRAPLSSLGRPATPPRFADAPGGSAKGRT
jgi:hypothetical protein